MSNEVSIFKNGGGLPAHLRKKELSEATKALMGGGSGKRLSIRGGVFRMVVNGQEVMRSEDRAMNIIIVAAAPKTSRHWYAELYQEGANVKPDCWSNDGERPDPNSEEMQSETCLTCPQNIAGSGQGDSRACRYLHRLAVVLENDLDSGDIYGLSLAATSLFGKGDAGKMPMMQYAKLLGGHGMDVSDVVTEMRFDTDSATPKLTFSAVRPLEEDEIETIIEYSESEEAHQAISFTDTSPAAEKAPLFPPKAAKPDEPHDNPKEVAPAPKTRTRGGPKPEPEPEATPEPEPEAKPAPVVKRRAVRAAPAAPKPQTFNNEFSEKEPIKEPVKRTVAAKPEPTNIDNILGEWGDE